MRKIPIIEYLLTTRVECVRCGRIIKRAWCPKKFVCEQLGWCKRCDPRECTRFPRREVVAIALVVLLFGAALVLMLF